jgi:hypothetical protein
VFRPSKRHLVLAAKQRRRVYGEYSLDKNGDLPVAGDYDSDGKDDVSVFRQGICIELTARTAGRVCLSFGFGTDLPCRQITTATISRTSPYSSFKRQLVLDNSSSGRRPEWNWGQ